MYSGSIRRRDDLDYSCDQRGLAVLYGYRHPVRRQARLATASMTQSDRRPDRHRRPILLGDTFSLWASEWTYGIQHGKFSTLPGEGARSPRGAYPNDRVNCQSSSRSTLEGPALCFGKPSHERGIQDRRFDQLRWLSGRPVCHAFLRVRDW